MPRLYNNKDIIAFYSREGEFPWMANTFRGMPIVDKDGNKWDTNEKFFQAQKVRCFSKPDGVSEQQFTVAKEGFLLFVQNYSGSYKDFPKEVGKYIKKNPCLQYGKVELEEWIRIQRDVMREAVQYKLDQYDGLKLALQAMSPTTVIVEATKNDNVWGDNDGRELSEADQQLRGTHYGYNYLGETWLEKMHIEQGMDVENAKTFAKSANEGFIQWRADNMNGQSLYQDDHPVRDTLASIIATIEVEIKSEATAGRYSRNDLTALSKVQQTLKDIAIANTTEAEKTAQLSRLIADFKADTKAAHDLFRHTVVQHHESLVNNPELTQFNALTDVLERKLESWHPATLGSQIAKYGADDAKVLCVQTLAQALNAAREAVAKGESTAREIFAVNSPLGISITSLATASQTAHKGKGDKLAGFFGKQDNLAKRLNGFLHEDVAKLTNQSAALKA